MASKLRTTALVSWTILMLGLSGQGCQQCVDPLDAVGADLGEDVEICKDPYREPTAPFPDMNVHPLRDTGPKDPDAIAHAMIFAKSCGMSLGTDQEDTINKVLTQVYYTHNDHFARWQSFFEYTACFKGKTTGCDTLRECWGFGTRIRDLNLEPIPITFKVGCENGISYTRWQTKLMAQDNMMFEYWENCAARGLECYDDGAGSYCDAPRTPCDPLKTDYPPCTTDNKSFQCKQVGEIGWSFEKRSCSDFGLMCNKDETGGGLPDCIGTGPACQLPDTWWHYDWFAYDYRMGAIACESETTLRSCVGVAEALVDCPSLGSGFQCISGATPYCGLTSECNVDTPVTCEGDTIVLCNAGQIQKFDCKSLGFEFCDPDAGACGPNTREYVPKTK